MRVTNWGLLLLAIYLILIGLNSFDIFFGLGRLSGIVALVAGILLLVENWRR